MKLVPVGREKKAAEILFNLLAERTQEESISHKGMPTWEEHLKFFKSNPYQCWYLIQYDGMYVGCCYISRQREIGISIFKAYRLKGYARQALGILIEKWPGKFYANINENNKKSLDLFHGMGFSTLQIVLTFNSCSKENKHL